jgi:hypothetical protein
MRYVPPLSCYRFSFVIDTAKCLIRHQGSFLLLRVPTSVAVQIPVVSMSRVLSCMHHLSFPLQHLRY